MMCGIFGIFNLGTSAPFDTRKFEAALGTIAHRGPDDQRLEVVGDEAILGHRRLSIIDLSDDSAQPMQAFGRYWLVYNGEIFNYIELRDELAALGARFSTTGDVEVLLNAYAFWGEECVSRFNGMWAFAIYDRQERTLFCSRDRFGIKPFNYAVFEGQLLFASEIKAIISYESRLIEPDYNMIANYCRTSVGAQHAQTWFKHVQRLQPGCNMIVRHGQVAIKRYWDYPEGVRTGLTFSEAKEEYGALFRDAVRLRMRSDVPLGVALSSGLDSTTITYAMQEVDPSPHYCFTARFGPEEGLSLDASIYVNKGEAIDESVTAKEVARELGLNSQVVDTDYVNFVGSLSRIVWHLESGNSAPAVIPLMQLLAQARKYVTVLLDGQGADELLAGYITTVFWPNQIDLISAGKLGSAWAALREYMKTYTVKTSVLMALRYASNWAPLLSAAQQRWTGISGVYGPKLRDHTRIADFPELPRGRSESHLGRQLRHLHSGGLVNLLHYGDAISMANSLEARMPFLDHRLVEFVWTLPADYKMRHGVAKYLHREAMRDLAPDWILDNRTKHGFTTPIGKQFKKDFPGSEGPVDVLLSDRCLSRGLFDREGLADIIEAHRKGRADHGPLLFRLLSTELWFRNFVDPQQASAA